MHTDHLWFATKLHHVILGNSRDHKNGIGALRFMVSLLKDKLNPPRLPGTSSRENMSSFAFSVDLDKPLKIALWQCFSTLATC